MSADISVDTSADASADVLGIIILLLSIEYSEKFLVVVVGGWVVCKPI